MNRQLKWLTAPLAIAIVCLGIFPVDQADARHRRCRHHRHRAYSFNGGSCGHSYVNSCYGRRNGYYGGRMGCCGSTASYGAQPYSAGCHGSTYQPAPGYMPAPTPASPTYEGGAAPAPPAPPDDENGQPPSPSDRIDEAAPVEGDTTNGDVTQPAPPPPVDTDTDTGAGNATGAPVSDDST
jgi:hypothetical protein